MSRGSSLLAGVLLVGILSSLAVALQGVDPRGIEEASSVAGARLATSHTPKAPMPAAGAPGQHARSCAPAFEYNVYVEKGKTVVECIKEKSHKLKSLRCPGAIAGCSNAADKDLKDYVSKFEDYKTGCKTKYKNEGYASEADCVAKMKSYCDQRTGVKFCPGGNPAGATQGKLTVKDKTGKVTKELQCKQTECDPTKAEKVASSAMKDFAKDYPGGLKDLSKDLGAADDETKKKLGELANAMGRESALGKDVLDEFNKDIEAAEKEAQKAAGEAKALAQKAEADRQAYLKCIAAKGSGQCGTEQGAANQSEADAAKAREEARKKQEELNRLRTLATTLKPGTPPPQYDKDGKCVANCTPPPGKGGDVGGGGGTGQGNGFGNTGQTGFGKSMSDLGKAMSGQQQQGNKQPGTGTNPQQQQQQQCYYGQQYAVQQNAYCSGGSMYAYNSQTCQYQAVQQCPSGRCTTTAGTDQNGNQRTVCAPTTPTTSQITATLSCSKKRADVGQKVTLEYACTGSEGMTATGNGFTTTSSVGTQEVTIQKPPRGANTVTYGLICKDGAGQTKAAEPCQVQIDQPLIVLVANPKQVKKGKDTTIGWVTKGMKSCVISTTDPDLASWSAEQAIIRPLREA